MRPTLPAALALAGLAVWATAVPAAAHGDSIHFQVSAQADGHTRATASYDDDGDPVDQPVTGTLTATATDGRTVGPWRLVALPGSPSAYTTAEMLPPGSWKVTVDSAFPDLGHGEAQLTVNAVPEAGPQPLGSSSATPTVSAAPSIPVSVQPAAAKPAVRPWRLALVVGVALVACVAVGVSLRLLRRR